MLTLPGTTHGRWRTSTVGSCNPSGEQSLIDALTISCNTAFAQLGIDLGEDKVREMAEAFGMDGEGFEIPLRVAASTVGDIENDAALGADLDRPARRAA